MLRHVSNHDSALIVKCADSPIAQLRAQAGIKSCRLHIVRVCYSHSKGKQKHCCCMSGANAQHQEQHNVTAAISAWAAVNCAAALIRFALPGSTASAIYCSSIILSCGEFSHHTCQRKERGHITSAAPSNFSHLLQHGSVSRCCI